MNGLLAFFQHHFQSSLLLKTLTLLTKFYSKDFKNDFYSVLRHISQIALNNTYYNNDEYIKELLTLFTVLPSVCPALFNADAQCIRDVLKVCEVYLHSASLQGKAACFRFLNRLLQMETDCDQIFASLNQIAPDLLHFVIEECINWERPVLRSGSSFLFHLMMVSVPQPAERSRIVVDALAATYPTIFTQEELAKIAGFMEK